MHTIYGTIEVETILLCDMHDSPEESSGAGSGTTMGENIPLGISDQFARNILAGIMKEADDQNRVED